MKDLLTKQALTLEGMLADINAALATMGQPRPAMPLPLDAEIANAMQVIDDARAKRAARAKLEAKTTVMPERRSVYGVPLSDEP